MVEVIVYFGGVLYNGENAVRNSVTNTREESPDSFRRQAEPISEHHKPMEHQVFHLVPHLHCKFCKHESREAEGIEGGGGGLQSRDIFRFQIFCVKWLAIV